MQRGRAAAFAGGFNSLMSSGKEMFRGKLAGVSPTGLAISTARFRGKLGAAIATITSMIVGFLTLPNNILYFIDSRHSARDSQCDKYTDDPARGRPEYEYAYIHAGIAVIILGCLALVVSIVLSFFAATSKRKMDDAEGSSGLRSSGDAAKGRRTIFACLIMMNVELFMAVVAGCMELLYRPLIKDEHRLHNVECAIAVFNVIIYGMYIATMVMTSAVLREKRCEKPCSSGSGHESESLARERSLYGDSRTQYSARGSSPYYSQQSPVYMSN